MLSGNKRRVSIKKQGKEMFCPDSEPCYSWGGFGRKLTNQYDKLCFMEGWNIAKDEYEILIQNEALAKIQNDE